MVTACNQTNDGSATDNCYEITNTWTATDNCGNTNMHTQVITVEDTTDPTFDNAPGNETIECDVTPIIVQVTASDNCDNDVLVEFVSTSNQTNDGSANDDCYEITNTWTATDNCGNTNMHTQVITVEDTTDPTFDNAPTNETIECNVTPNIVDVTASDNCCSLIHISEPTRPY